MKSLRIAVTTLGTIAIFAFAKPTQKLETPPNCFAITNNLYCDKTEITNQDWREYLFWNAHIFGKNSPEHLAAYPDTAVWRQTNISLEPFAQQYFSHPAYNLYPVVGITQKQAEEYTLWRTDQYFEIYLIGLKKIAENKAPTKQNYFTTARFFAGEIEDLKPELAIIWYPKFMLPSETQQRQIADHAKQIDGNYYNNYNFEKPATAKGLTPMWVTDTNSLVSKIGPTNAVQHKETKPFKNNYPYHIYDNVAEWSSKPGVAFGSSWRKNIGDATTTQNVENGAASVFVGFRNVCVWQKLGEE